MKPKHQEFINEYIRLKCSNATEAYQCVYPDCSYEAARRNASRLLTNADILAEIQRRVDAHTMSANEVLLRQAEIARSDIGEFLEQAEDGEVSVRLTDPKTNERKRTHLIKRITQRKVVRTIKDMTETETTLTLELHDAQAAQVQLGKHHKLWTDRIEEKAEVEIKNVHDITERLASRIASLATRIGAPTLTGGDSTK